MSNVVETLVEMGFSREKAELAVSRSNSNDVNVAMDWLLSHEDEVDSIISNQPEVSNALGNEAPGQSVESVNNLESNVNSEAIAKSIKCDDCGKLFQMNEEVEFHAAKTGHGNFSESTEEKKPLTEEEKKERLAKIEEKLRQRRLEREAKEKEEAQLREKSRIKSGKELLEAKKKREELEMKNLLEQRKREKEEMRLAKERVKQQIEEDKLVRRERFGGKPLELSQATAPPKQVSSKQTTNYNEVKLQIRLLDGQTLTETFKAKEPLSAVRLYVEMNRKDGDGPFKLMTSFPRKVFNTEDYDKPLDALGLAPTATLFIAKC